MTGVKVTEVPPWQPTRDGNTWRVHLELDIAEGGIGALARILRALPGTGCGVLYEPTTDLLPLDFLLVSSGKPSADVAAALLDEARTVWNT